MSAGPVVIAKLLHRGSVPDARAGRGVWAKLLELSHPSRARVSLASSGPTVGVTLSNQVGLPFPMEIKESQIVFLR